MNNLNGNRKNEFRRKQEEKQRKLALKIKDEAGELRLTSFVQWESELNNRPLFLQRRRYATKSRQDEMLNDTRQQARTAKSGLLIRLKILMQPL